MLPFTGQEKAQDGKVFETSQERIDWMSYPSRSHDSRLSCFTLFHNLTRVWTMKKGYRITALKPTTNILLFLLPDFTRFMENPRRWVNWSREWNQTVSSQPTAALVKGLFTRPQSPSIRHIPKQKSPACLFCKVSSVSNCYKRQFQKVQVNLANCTLLAYLDWFFH